MRTRQRETSVWIDRRVLKKAGRNGGRQPLCVTPRGLRDRWVRANASVRSSIVTWVQQELPTLT
jgi:hypothetical protein